MRRLVNLWSGLAVVVLLAGLFIWEGGTPKRPRHNSNAQALVRETYRGLPLCFEPNWGQSDSLAKFVSRGNGYRLALRAGEAVLSLSGDAVQVRFLGANPEAQVEALDPLPGRSHYFLGRDPARWRTSVPHYGRVRYRDLYPGVDLVFYGGRQRLEYDFIVAPGADPSRIQLGFGGVTETHLDPQGDLILKTVGGEIRQRKPVLYQGAAAARRAIDGRYVLTGRDQAHFEVGRYDPTAPLTIDPVLDYSTYLGGNGEEWGNAVAVDGAGNSYITGSTSGTNFPTTPGAYRAGKVGQDVDAFVVKMNAAGTGVVYSTYLGGSGDDTGGAIAVDAAGNAYVGGYTTSTDFPTTSGAFQASFRSGNPTDHDAWVLKLNASGSALLYSTYLGGSKDDILIALAVDLAGNAYAAGGTGSTDFPTTPAAFQPRFAGGDNDAFITKLNVTGTALLYSTYLGGSSRDPAWGIAVDAAGDAYVTGPTRSGDFPTTPGAFQTKFGGGIRDIYVAKLRPTGGALVYSTFLGGSDDEQSTFLALDAAGSAYVTGYTTYTNFPTTPGAFRTSFQGGATGSGGDAFVAKLNTTGAALVYSTYLGGSGEDGSNGIAVDAAGNAYVTGFTNSADFPTVRPLQLAFGGRDAFVAKLNPAGSALVYSTYLGGQDADTGVAIALDFSGNAAVTGRTASSNFPVVPGALQSGSSAHGAAFFARVSDSLDQRPALNIMLHAATYSGGAAAPGEIVTFYGAGIGPDSLATLQLNAAGLVDTTLADTRVLFDGAPAPLLYVQAGQTGAIVPYAVAGKDSTRVQIEFRGVKSNAVAVRVVSAKPGIFTLDSSGKGQGAILNQNSTANSASNSAVKGSVVVIYGSGEGQTDPPGVDGKLAAGSPPKPHSAVQVLIDGKPADVLYAGGAPGQSAGVLQVNARVPANASPGVVEVQLQIGGESSPGGVTIAVQ